MCGRCAKAGRQCDYGARGVPRPSAARSHSQPVLMPKTAGRVESLQSRKLERDFRKRNNDTTALWRRLLLCFAKSIFSLASRFVLLYLLLDASDLSYFFSLASCFLLSHFLMLFVK